MQLRTLLVLLSGLLGAFQASAQITINRADFPRPADLQDTIVLSSLADASFDLAEGDGQVWDFSALQPMETRVRVYQSAAADTLLPNAFQKEDINLFFQAFPIPTTLYTGLDDEGWYDVGRVTTSVKYPIAQITGSPTDTLAFPGLVQEYPGRINTIQFPMAFGDEWEQTHLEQTPYELTVAAFGLNQTPGLNRRSFTEKREVVGSGEIRLPRGTDEPQLSTEVLLVRITTTAIDSFFLGGAPAPAPLLAAFGISQAQVSVGVRFVFYRPGAGAPVADIFENNRFITYRPRLAEPLVSVREHFLPSVRHYPNPIAAGTPLTIEAGQPIGSGRVEVVDMQGRRVFQQDFRAAGSQSLTLDLPANLPTGLYVYHLRNTAGQRIWAGRLQVMQ
ncbi:T9SS type A sorting domain-containing protein [Neolewinella lacunae]|uniref:T9SS type A sorting domain-containing protein n=1 Tax=Neolewinella lacunae TaxID=1517758 RepID=A0A923T8P4_9BACT|nr:T9SS type A sorting domain-containing protein [Neolewinella lacunae]MBC6994183.1 T9SS type A sorting domain-containing protein [Neolewinella lacunae]MDN3634658.1 T9SS type A sorting domain-containing protein [Neolewinella lacunae]